MLFLLFLVIPVIPSPCGSPLSPTGFKPLFSLSEKELTTFEQGPTVKRVNKGPSLRPIPSLKV